MNTFHPWELQEQGPVACAAGQTVTAEFYPGMSPVLDVYRIADGRRERIGSWAVANKREARALATKLGATPWNF